MKLKSLMSLTLAGALSVGMLAGCGGTASTQEASSIKAAGQYSGTITILMSANDAFLSTLSASAKAAGEAQGLDVVVQDCSQDMDKQLEYIEAAKTDGQNVIVVNIVNPDRGDEVIEAADDMKVVFLNRMPTDAALIDEDHPYIGSDEVAGGTMQGEILADYLKAQGKTEANYLFVSGTENHNSTINRKKYCLEALDKAGIKVNEVAMIKGEFIWNTALQETLRSIVSGELDMSKVDTIISSNDDMLTGVREALSQSEVDYSNMAIIGYDGIAAGLQAIKDGTQIGSVYQSGLGQGTAAVQAAVNLATGADLMADMNSNWKQDTENKAIVWVPFEKITPDNVNDY